MTLRVTTTLKFGDMGTCKYNVPNITPQNSKLPCEDDYVGEHLDARPN